MIEPSRSSSRDPLFELDAPTEESGSDFHLADYLDVLRRRWRLAAVIALLCLVGGLVHYFITPKMYQATTTIQIDRKSLSLGGSLETPWLENWWNMEFYPTQYKLLESRGLAERVVRNLRLYEDPVFNPGWARWEGPEEATPELDQARLGRLGERLQRGLQVSPIKNTQLVALSYRSSSPELTARVANGVADAFIDWGIETRSETVGKASSFLGKQIEELKQQIQDKEARLQAYSRRTDIVAIDPESNPTLQKLAALNQDYMEAVSRRIEKEARYNEVLQSPEESVADPLSGGLVSSLRKELLQAEQEYATKLNVYKPDMPRMVELKAKIEELRDHLGSVVDEMAQQARKTAKAEYQTALRREQSIKEELDKAKEETIELGSAAVEYNNLQMEIATSKQLLDELLRRQSETEVTARLQATRQSNVRVVDRALVPGGPYRPSLRKDLAMSLALGLFLGVGCVFLLEYLDRTLKTAEEAERLLGLPVLAVIPDIGERSGGYGSGYGYGYGYGFDADGSGRKKRGKSGKKGDEESSHEIELLPFVKPRHAVSEAYRSLRTALLLSTTDDLGLITVTSGRSGEGKTSTVANLAVVMAQLGRRVLLIDADLRKPRQHRLFSVSNRSGLVNCLTGTGSFDDTVRETEVPGLSVLPSGTTPPNPSELLASDRMQQLLADADRRYDLVLMDTPPLLAVTDASLLASMSDGTVVCLQAGRILKDEAVECCDRLRLAGIRILGTVLNRYRIGKRGEAKRYAYYYQAYGEGRQPGSADSAA
ncbi:MAG: polysaccharide biosynthesis tyrosine autokinase [Thermoanaerobaculia bacterium]|nr:polysaccharide biosynthesis tyrosine autokinase [Thermoanaerobaculia bacterium]